MKRCVGVPSSVGPRSHFCSSSAVRQPVRASCVPRARLVRASCVPDACVLHATHLGIAVVVGPYHCSGQPAGWCATTCSPAMKGDNFCDAGCNIAACDFDGGDCTYSGNPVQESIQHAAACLQDLELYWKHLEHLSTCCRTANLATRCSACRNNLQHACTPCNIVHHAAACCKLSLACCKALQGVAASESVCSVARSAPWQYY